MPLELFLSLTGVILFTPIFQPEQDREIADLVAAKYYRQEIVWLIRLGCSVLAVTAFLSLFTGYLKLRGCDTAPVLVFGTMADALFLGAMGMLTSSLADNTVIGYMPPLFYYALNIGMGQKLGSFYLFSMATGNYGAKLSLFAAGVLMTAAAFAGKRIKKRTQ